MMRQTTQLSAATVAAVLLGCCGGGCGTGQPQYGPRLRLYGTDVPYVNDTFSVTARYGGEGGGQIPGFLDNHYNAWSVSVPPGGSVYDERRFAETDGRRTYTFRPSTTGRYTVTFTLHETLAADSPVMATEQFSRDVLPVPH